MKSIRFSIATLLLIAIAMQTASAQRYLSEKTPDLALVSCTSKWLNKEQVSVTWTVRNDGTAICPLTGKNGEGLVSLNVDGTFSKTADAASNDWRSLVSPDEAIYMKYGDLRPGETATGSFVFKVNEGVWNHEEQLVSYRVTLDTDNIGTKELNKENNVYVGLVGK
jgi:CARDB